MAHLWDHTVRRRYLGCLLTFVAAGFYSYIKATANKPAAAVAPVAPVAPPAPHQRQSQVEVEPLMPKSQQQ